jgi:hypothetical protein
VVKNVPAPKQAAGYSGTPLAKKLGLREGSRFVVVNAPPHYRQLLAPLPARVTTSARVSDRTDIVHVFVRRRSELAHTLASLREGIRPDAAVWISWPKKASKVATDITEQTIRDEALPLGFVDVKVCAVDETWSGLKLVVRKTLR